MTTVKDLINSLLTRHPDAQVFFMTQRKQPFENHVAGVVGREEMLDQQWRVEPGVERDDVFLVVGKRIRPGSLSGWIVAESQAAQAPADDDTTMTRWKATMTQIAEHYLGIDTLEERGRDSLDFHAVGVAALSSALTSAYRAGIAAGVRHVLGPDERTLEAETNALEGASPASVLEQARVSTSEAVATAPGAPASGSGEVSPIAAEASVAAPAAPESALDDAPDDRAGHPGEVASGATGDRA
jgi:hypothetical protein